MFVIVMFASAQECSRIIDRFINRTVTLDYLQAGCPTSNSLVNAAEDRLLSSVIHSGRPLCSPPVLSPPYPHQTAWPAQKSAFIYPTLKRCQAMQCIARVLFRALLPSV